MMDTSRVMAIIESADDPEKLRRLIENARRKTTD